MTKHCNLNVNSGFKKRTVFNRTAFNRLEKANKALSYDTRRMQNARIMLEKIRVQIEKNKGGEEKKLKKLEAQKTRIEKKISEQNAADQRIKLGKIAEKKSAIETAHGERARNLSKNLKELVEKMNMLVKRIEKDHAEVEKWEKRFNDTPLYEIEPEMDHTMTNFKILLENSIFYTKSSFFDDKIGTEMLFRVFITHHGDPEILDGGKKYRFKLNKFDNKGHMRKAKKACKRFNEKHIRTSDGILLEMAVKR